MREALVLWFMRSNPRGACFWRGRLRPLRSLGNSGMTPPCPLATRLTLSHLRPSSHIEMITMHTARAGLVVLGLLSVDRVIGEPRSLPVDNHNCEAAGAAGVMPPPYGSQGPSRGAGRACRLVPRRPLTPQHHPITPLSRSTNSATGEELSYDRGQQLLRQLPVPGTRRFGVPRLARHPVVWQGILTSERTLPLPHSVSFDRQCHPDTLRHWRVGGH